MEYHKAVLALELKDVSKSFDSKSVLEKISFDLAEGELVSVVGPSGSGKTTLLRIIAGHDFPDPGGQMFLYGQNLVTLPARQRPIHTVFQRYALFPHMTVFENVAFGLRVKGVAKTEISKQVAEALQVVGLSPLASQPVTTLSGGEQQRVALIRALINKPKILLLDEPLSAIDPQLRMQLQGELKAVQRQFKTSFLLVTHNQEEALNLSDRIVVLSDGKIEQIGSPHEVYESPKSLFAAQFMGPINIVKTSAGMVGIRPEKIMLYSSRPSLNADFDGCSVEGTVSDHIYLGGSTQYTVNLVDGSNVKVIQQNTQKISRNIFSIGNRVTLVWPKYAEQRLQ